MTVTVLRYKTRLTGCSEICSDEAVRKLPADSLYFLIGGEPDSLWRSGYENFIQKRRIEFEFIMPNPTQERGNRKNAYDASYVFGGE